MSAELRAEPFRILLVEDEPADAFLVRIALEEYRILTDLHVARDGLEALDVLRGAKGGPVLRPDIILLDLNMPRMNGREFLAEVKKDPELHNIPVVVLTTSDVERDVVASYEMGAAGYVTKPIDVEQFANAVRTLGDYWFALVKLPHNTRA